MCCDEREGQAAIAFFLTISLNLVDELIKNRLDPLVLW
jgi:hypothetical protein